MNDERPAGGSAADAPVRILVADASPGYRNALARLLQGQPVEIVGEARDTIELTLAVERLQPDVILLDPELPGVDGLQLAARVAGETPSPGVIFLSLVAGRVKHRSSNVRDARFVLKEYADQRLVDQILELGRRRSKRSTET
jgi:two-component system response regulator DesR